MKKTRVTVKSVFKYLSTVITWVIFVILILCAIFLGYYYISMKVYASKGESYAPKFSIYTIVSPSMTPNIKVYDVIINEKIDSPMDIQIGDVITFKSTSSITYGMTITHRVKEVQIVNGEYQFVTKGDNNTGPDTAPALYSNVIGRVIFKLPQLGRIQFFVASKFGWLVVIVIPALLIILNDIKKLLRLSKIKKDAGFANKNLVKLHDQDNYINISQGQDHEENDYSSLGGNDHTNDGV